MIEFLRTFTFYSATSTENDRLFIKIRKKTKELHSMYETIIEDWCNAIEEEGYETAGHTERIAKIVISIAEKMNLNNEQIQKIIPGILLHNIGLIGIPDLILQKPFALNEEERMILKKNPFIAYYLLQPIEFLQEAIQIPFCHHEKWDGSGYPRGLKGDQIPCVVRIFTIVKVWDALLSDRPYRQAWPERKVMEYMHEQSGKHFDPEILEVFLGYIQVNKEKYY